MKFNIGVNCGEAAGQTVFHAHIHIIRRYHGDVANPRGEHAMAAAEVDLVAVIIFLEDRTCNLVLAWRKCNNDKRDKLTSVDTVDRLCARNERALKKHVSADRDFIGTLMKSGHATSLAM